MILELFPFLHSNKKHIQRTSSRLPALVLLFLLIFFPFSKAVHAQDDMSWWNDLVGYDGVTPWANYLRYAPLYFGPNAFPVPEMNPHCLPKTHKVSAKVDQYFGYGDLTTDLNLRLDFALLPEFLVFSLWLVPIEYYKTSLEVRDFRRSREVDPRGTATGDLYVQTGIQLLKNKKHLPDIVFNATFKTASGGKQEGCRYYDTPGYYFDITFGKSWQWGGKDDPFDFHLSALGGFLCWQSMQNYQDDAAMYGLKVGADYRKWLFQFDWSGYAGWAIHGNSPSIFRFKFGRQRKQHGFFVGGLHGWRDYPFHQVNLTYEYSFASSFGKRKP